MASIVGLQNPPIVPFPVPPYSAVQYLLKSDLIQYGAHNCTCALRNLCLTTSFYPSRWSRWCSAYGGGGVGDRGGVRGCVARPSLSAAWAVVFSGTGPWARAALVVGVNGPAL